ncbi:MULTISPECIES: hypothetical protein [Chryseobacterium]|nr:MULTISPECIES: hypothetical protein [Chryseobacterium]QQV02996.1 hypothetical protein I6I61_01130 [Chryseobacterium sp. FDAARGOS 1104]
MLKKRKVLIIILLALLLLQSCKKISHDESMNSFMYHLKDNIYLDNPTRSILVKKKIGDDSFIIEKVIVDKIDSIFINNDKTTIYIVNDQSEYILVNSDFKAKRLKKRPNVDFKSIISYHD